MFLYFLGLKISLAQIAHLTDRVKKLEKEVAQVWNASPPPPEKARLDPEVNNQIRDVKRQLFKTCLIFSGSDIPPQRDKNEDIEKILRHLMWRKYRLELDPRDVAQVHRLGDGIICQFNDR